MDPRGEWNRTVFESLTSRRLSRNKHFASFAEGWFKAVHKRFRVVSSLKQDAARLGSIPDTNCWVSEENDGLLFHLQSPRLRYRRVVALHSYEWEWLVQQKEIRCLLNATPRDALPSG